MRSYAAERPVI